MTAAPNHTTLARAQRDRWRWTSLVGRALQVRLRRRAALLSDRAYWTRSTARVQVNQLRGLLALAQGTVFGREHDFARISRLPDDQLVDAYRSAVPVAEYSAYRALITRMRDQGEPDVLWPGLVMDYAQTSGTTAGDKYIPVSRQMLKSNYTAALDIFANASRFGVQLPRLLRGKALFLGGSTELAVNDRGIRTGDLSGLVTPLIRWPISEIYAPGPKIALISHWPTKLEAMAKACIDQDIRMINGMPSWALVLFEKVLELARQRGQDVRSVREVWPNLTLFVHGGVKYAPFDPRVRQYFSGDPAGQDIPHRLELYPASEGFIAMQDTPGDPGLRLLSDIGNFYEFVPLEEVDSPSPRAFTADRVEKGQKYVVTMSTCAGLWRYLIGDVVMFDSVPAGLSGRGGDGPSRLRIVGRHRHFINAFGENLIVEHIENAVAHAAKASGLSVGEFTAAPVYPAQGRRAGLELAVEIARTSMECKPGALPAETLERFARAFDESLKSQNVDYTTKRTDGVGMSPPTITPLPMGAFHRWLDRKGKLGGQHKCPRCANHRDILSEVVDQQGA